MLDQKEITIGRNENNVIFINDKRLSGIHCRIFKEGILKMN
jgi:pSer/pThr/pTyr-binding forkhead associated (FHA) protein